MKAADKLRATWSRREDDVMLHYPLGFGTKRDGALLASVFSKEFTAELSGRGYDPTTMKFSVEPKAGDPKFSSQRA